MGMTITGHRADMQIDWGYGGLHRVRTLALITAGFDEIYPEYEHELEYLAKYYSAHDYMMKGTGYLEIVKKYPQVAELIAHSDCDGIYLREYIVEGIDTTQNVMIGNLDQLMNELEMIKQRIMYDTNILEQLEEPVELFRRLYDLVENVVHVNEGTFILFH